VNIRLDLFNVPNEQSVDDCVVHGFPGEQKSTARIAHFLNTRRISLLLIFFTYPTHLCLFVLISYLKSASSFFKLFLNHIKILKNGYFLYNDALFKILSCVKNKNSTKYYAQYYLVIISYTYFFFIRRLILIENSKIAYSFLIRINITYCKTTFI